MKTRQDIANELILKEERIAAWENYGLLDRDGLYEEPKIEYWYMNEVE